MLVWAPIHYTVDSDPKAIGFWMKIEGEDPVRAVRVCVTYEALADIDPNQPQDGHGWMTTLDNNRDRIDMAANSKFDAGEVESDLHEEKPVIILRTDDL